MGFIYFISVLFVLTLFILIPKAKHAQNIIIWLPMSYIGYECYITLIGGLLTLLHIPVYLFSISIINYVLGIFLLGYLLKIKKIQTFYWDKLDSVVFLFLIVGILIFSLNHFTPDLRIRFETSDPGTHLKIAMDVVNSRSVISDFTSMYMGQLTNGLWIEMLMPFFKGTFVYKSFILKQIFNFIITSVAFYSCLRLFVISKRQKMGAITFTLLYIAGYPLSDFLFGFVYLGIAITVIMFCFFMVYHYLYEDMEESIILFCISIGCLGVGVGYTLFAPIVFFAIFFCVLYKFAQKSKPKKIIYIVDKKFIFHNLYIFLIPAFFSLWFTFIYPKITGTGQGLSDALTSEGYIYRSLYSDFIIFIPFALVSISHSFKDKKWNLFSTLFPLTIIYCSYFFIQMYNGKVSTYYYYKLNFVLWLIIILLAFVGTIALYKKSKTLVCSYWATWGLILIISISGVDTKLNSKNVLLNPFPNAHSTFEIYIHNKIIYERKSEVDKGLSDLCVYIEQKLREEIAPKPILFVGDWLDTYWFEALSNQRMKENYVFNDPTFFIKKFLERQYSSYIVISKDSKEYALVKDLLLGTNQIYENEYGYVLTLSNAK